MEETRIPWYERGFGERVVPGTRPRVSFGRDWLRAGALELFTDTVRGHEPLLHTLSDEEPRAAVRGGRTPRLAELRTQQSTVWSWNRPVYDPADGGHLRIEFRALPSGPTLTDIVANAAFLLGLVLDVASEDLEPAAHVPFALARADFYAAARFGLESRLHWPFAPSGHAVPHRAAGLVLGLLPHAARGLRRAGVHPDEAGRWLAVVEERVRTGRTGARWQRAMLDAQSPARCRQAAAHALVRRYQALSEPDLPVHTWPEEAAARGVPG
ncbi:hypothetical protein [Streptomyces sp. enrichment culture]|uniref:hypothetical protein n=1 Tax=Streptomyces sp. enrichment culture TaxID=1795815 RepID=UPI003F57616D